LKKLHARWGERVQFVDVFIRQAHPGPDVPAYRRIEQKMKDAQDYRRDEGIPWTVLVDDLPGTAHQVYGSMAAPTYLLDAEGRVSYYVMWTSAPSLHAAIDALLQQGGSGIVLGGIDRVPHLAASMTDGWRALRRGGWQSFLDLETAMPSMAATTWLGYQLRPVLAPLTLRATPMPPAAKAALALGATLTLALAVRRMMASRQDPSGWQAVRRMTARD